MDQLNFEGSLKEGQHLQLKKMTGEWSGVTRVWFSKDELVDESVTKGRIHSTMGGRFVIHEYKGSFQGKELEGIAVYGFDLSQDKFQCAWADSFHMSTGIMFSESREHATSFDVLGHYRGSRENPELWGWRTEVVVIEDELLITMYNISPQGEEVKAVETKYKRLRVSS